MWVRLTLQVMRRMRLKGSPLVTPSQPTFCAGDKAADRPAEMVLNPKVLSELGISSGEDEYDEKITVVIHLKMLTLCAPLGQ